MGWYADEFQQRIAISIVNTGGTATPDIAVVIPDTLDRFWDVIDSSALELRVTNADGYTLVAYKLSGLTYATRTLVIQVDELPAPGNADELLLCWLYWDTTSTQGDGATGTTITSAETGVIDEALPSGRQITARRQRPGRARPQDLVLKSVADDLDVWLDVSQILETRSSPFDGRNVHEEPQTVEITAEDDAAADKTSTLIDMTDCTWVETRGNGNGGRRMWLRCRLNAGVDDTNYTVKPAMTTRSPNVTGTHRTIESALRFAVRVTDQVEPAT